MGFLGLLPVRTDDKNHYPGPKKYLLGVWTNDELTAALKEGYKLIDIQWTITYETAPENPFTNYFKELYDKRIQSVSNYDYWFWKQIMNRTIGKFAQVKESQDIRIDSIEKDEELAAQGYEPVMRKDRTFIYKKEKTNGKKKPYYCPIIPCQVVSGGRLYMYQHYQKIPHKDLVYTDTDNIL